MNKKAEWLPARLKQLRESRGWTQTQLAEACGINASMIGHYEIGSREPLLSQFVRLCEGLGIGMDAFYTRENPFETIVQVSHATPRGHFEEKPFVVCNYCKSVRAL
jgi:transcriptional regulator with XRE-family HTH domain